MVVAVVSSTEAVHADVAALLGRRWGGHGGLRDGRGAEANTSLEISDNVRVG